MLGDHIALYLFTEMLNFHSKIPGNYTEDEVLSALPSLSEFIDHRWSSQYNTNELQVVHDVLEFNRISVRSAVRELGVV